MQNLHKDNHIEKKLELKGRGMKQPRKHEKKRLSFIQDISIIISARVYNIYELAATVKHHPTGSFHVAQLLFFCNEATIF